MNIALILSGGCGSRIGLDIPKQYLSVGGKPIISYCMEVLFAYSGIEKVQIVADKTWQRLIEMEIRRLSGGGKLAEKFCGFSRPGETRQLSIVRGLKDIRSYAGPLDYVLIHDAARPLVSGELVKNCLRAAEGHEGVVPMLPMKDTVYRSSNGMTITALMNRSQVFAGQAPEVFLLEKYYEANMRLLPKRILKISGSAEPAVRAGMDIIMLPGDERNFKITTREDLERFVRITEENGSR